MGKTQPNEKAHGFVLSARAGGLFAFAERRGGFFGRLRKGDTIFAQAML
jgi:hypothetical protein